MSRAFVKEPDGENVQDDTPDIPISPHPNYVTVSGLTALERERDQLLASRQEIKSEEDQVAARLKLFPVERRLRYVLARLETAQLCVPDQWQEVAIGHQVLVADEEDQESLYAIVGEDEADIARGWISWISPLGKALLEAEVGDLVKWRRPVGDRELEILEIATFQP